MTFAGLNNAQTTWYKANRPGTAAAAAGTPGTALVSDLQAEDYLVGARLRVISTGTTVSGVRTLTVERPAQGITHTVQWVAASSVIIIRP